MKVEGWEDAQVSLGRVCASPCGGCGDASWGGWAGNVFVYEVQV